MHSQLIVIIFSSKKKKEGRTLFYPRDAGGKRDAERCGRVFVVDSVP